VNVSTKKPQAPAETQDFITQKLTPFWNTALPALIEKFIPQDSREEVKNLLAKDASWKDVFQLYILMKGNADMSALSAFKKSTVFLKLWDMMSGNGALR